MIAKKNPLCMEIKKSGIILRDDLEIVRVMRQFINGNLVSLEILSDWVFCG
jgi:hypothetical protein